MGAIVVRHNDRGTSWLMKSCIDCVVVIKRITIKSTQMFI